MSLESRTTRHNPNTADEGSGTMGGKKFALTGEGWGQGRQVLYMGVGRDSGRVRKPATDGRAEDERNNQWPNRPPGDGLGRQEEDGRAGPGEKRVMDRPTQGQGSE